MSRGVGAVFIVAILSGVTCREQSVQTAEHPVSQKGTAPANSEAMTRSAQGAERKAEMDAADTRDLTFGRIYPISSAKLKLDNPHASASYAVRQCIAGRGAELAIEMKHVESDPDLGSAFDTFIEVFCPDLERYRPIGSKIALRFDGYALNPTTSVWYYSLTDVSGKPLSGAPWVSLHRSRTSRRCALTGIFLPEGGKAADPMPTDLIRSAA